MFEIKKPTSSNKTIRMPDLLIDKLEQLAFPVRTIRPINKSKREAYSTASLFFL